MMRDDINHRSELKIGIVLGALGGATVVLLVFLGLALGGYLVAGRYASVTVGTEKESVVNTEALQKMGFIEDLVNEQYYDYNDLQVTESVLEEGIYDGMLAALKDPYTVYFTPEELQKQQESNEGIYHGIGLYISQNKETNYPWVSGVVEGGPSEDADVRIGDVIYAIDGVSTYKMSLAELSERGHGESGTEVELTLQRNGKLINVTIVRGTIDRPSVTYRMLGDDVGYIRIAEFTEVAVDQFTESYAVIREKGAKALVLDLRSNPGGLLSSVVEIGRQIFPAGVIVYDEDRYGKKQEYTCDGTREIQMPLVVLVNGASASASEVLVGAVKDYGIGTIIGTTTFGKGIVQKIYRLDDGSAVKMTVSAYFSPKGTNIQGTGIEPDIKVEFDSDLYYGEENRDNQLEAAVECLRKKLN